MTRVALVTGGTRGIGAATSRALKAAGYSVAATYVGNTQAAMAFQSESGVQTHQWDIGKFEACSLGIRAVEAALGSVDVLVNNAGIVRDSALHKMTPEQWNCVVRTNLDGLFNMCRHVIVGMRAREIRPHHQYFIDQRSEGAVRTGKLFRSKGRGARLYQSVGA